MIQHEVILNLNFDWPKKKFSLSLNKPGLASRLIVLIAFERAQIKFWLEFSVLCDSYS